MITYAIDFETYYDKEVSINTLGYKQYTQQTDIYLVSIVGSDGFQYVGHPAQAPWQQLTGAVWVSHHRTFDQACFEELLSSNVIAEVDYHVWHCTADMVAYLGYARSLDTAAKELLQIDVSKQVRANMKGRQYNQLTTEETQQLHQYALDDAILCLKLWQQYEAYFPEFERKISQHTTKMCLRGIDINQELLEQSKNKVNIALWENKKQIPWAETHAITSRVQCNLHCAKLNLPKPPNITDNPGEYANWIEQYGEKAPFVEAMSKHRSYNRLLTILERMAGNAVENRLSYGIKYFGAHTGRFSGDTGLNMQNFSRDAVVGVNVRNILVPAAGKQFIVADYSQIEARVLLWLAGDTEQLALIADGLDVYEAHARATMNYNDPRPLKEVDPNLRQYAKARVLGLGFQCGGKRFKGLAKKMCNLDLTATEAASTVNSYRRSNPKITAIWAQLERDFKNSRKEGEYVIELPSSRKLTYRNVTSAGGWQAYTVKGGSAPRKHLYGGLLTENLVQATARDIICEAILALEAAGYPVVLHVHDEVILEVAMGTDTQPVIDIMTASLPTWTEGLPLAVDAQNMAYYRK